MSIFDIKSKASVIDEEIKVLKLTMIKIHEAMQNQCRLNVALANKIKELEKQLNLGPPELL